MKNSRQLLLRVVFLAGVLTAFSWTIAQTAAPSSQVGAPLTPQVPVVMLDTVVTDKRGHSIDDVRRDELQVVEDGKPQEIYSFSKETKPAKYVIAIDASGSFRTVFESALDACRLIIEGNSEKDRTALIRFVSSDKITRVQDFTADKARLDFQLQQLYVEGGPSAVIDATFAAVLSLTPVVAPTGPPESEPRQAAVLITDGEDRRSSHKLEELVKLLRESEGKVFVIGIVGELNKKGGLTKPSPRNKAEELLNRVAKESGGRVLFVNDAGELRTTAQEIAHDLHTQYEIGYRVSEPHAKGFHKVEVKTLGPRNLKAFTRPGYLTR